MDGRKNNRGITAVVPAYNEAERIGAVLDVLTTYKALSEVIVVDDGSTDNTKDVVKKYPVKYIKNTVNQGKGKAMDKGVAHAKSDIIFFVDADVKGLTHQVIEEVVGPVVNDETEMFIGMRNRKLYYLRYFVFLVPLLGGERALTKRLWHMLPAYYKHRFRVEAGLNFYAQYYGKGLQYKIFQGLSQVIKEKKYGFVKGFKQRIGMTINIITAQLKLQFVNVPENLKSRRRLTMVMLQSLVGMALGLLFLSALLVGPRNVPIVSHVFYITNISAKGIIAAAGAFLIMVNMFAFIFTVRKLEHIFWKLRNRIKNQKI